MANNQVSKRSPIIGWLKNMTKYFHVDRLSKLQQGMILNKKRYNDVDPKFLQAHIDSLFPDGVTNHGELHLLRGQPLNINDSLVDLLFEYVRRSHFSDKPSRYESIFAFHTIEDANRFKRDYKCLNAPVWELEPVNDSKIFIGNMHYLTFNGSPLVISYYAHEYWKGNRSGDPSPLYEVLLTPPVKVVNLAQP